MGIGRYLGIGLIGLGSLAGCGDDLGRDDKFEKRIPQPQGLPDPSLDVGVGQSSSDFSYIERLGDERSKRSKKFSGGYVLEAGTNDTGHQVLRVYDCRSEVERYMGCFMNLDGKPGFEIEHKYDWSRDLKIPTESAGMLFDLVWSDD